MRYYLTAYEVSKYMSAFPKKPYEATRIDAGPDETTDYTALP